MDKKEGEGEEQKGEERRWKKKNVDGRRWRVVFFFLIQNFLDERFDLIDYQEGNRHVAADSSHPGAHPLIKSSETVGLPDGGDAVEDVAVFVGLEALHFGLDDVNGGVADHAGGTGGGAHQQSLDVSQHVAILAETLVWIFAQHVLQ